LVLFLVAAAALGVALSAGIVIRSHRIHRSGNEIVGTVPDGGDVATRELIKV
jgi:hypothetical protein